MGLDELRKQMFRQLGSDADHEELRKTWQQIEYEIDQLKIGQAVIAKQGLNVTEAK